MQEGWKVASKVKVERDEARGERDEAWRVCDKVTRERDMLREEIDVMKKGESILVIAIAQDRLDVSADRLIQDPGKTPHPFSSRLLFNKGRYI